MAIVVIFAKINPYKNMEKDTNQKIDELAAMVKDNASAIDELATIVKSGFDHVGKQFESIHADMSASRAEIKSEISELRIETHEGFSRVDDELLKNNDKIDLIAEKLMIKKVISKEDAKEVMSLGSVPLS
jgi:hypothetical protein